MSLTPHGRIAFAAGANKTTGAIIDPLCPLVVKSIGNASVAIAGGASGAATLNASLTVSPPTILSIEAQIQAFIASLNFAITAGAPNVSFSATAAAQLVADLGVSLALLPVLTALLSLPVVVGWLGYPYPLPGTGLGAYVTASSLTPVDYAIVLAAVDIPLLTSGVARQKLEQFLSGASYPGVGAFSNLGQLSPVTLNAIEQGEASIRYQLKMATLLATHLTVTPPTFSASIKAMTNFKLGLLPKVNFALNATAKLAADLNAKFSALIQLGLALNRPDGALYVYTWDDTGPPGLGGELTAELATTWNDGVTSTSLPCEALVLGTADPISKAALNQFFAGAA
jgi:hypothetical protein